MESWGGRGKAGRRKSDWGSSRDIACILLVSLGLFVFISLVTYHPLDPSFLTNEWAPARNACGRLGAFTSALFMNFLGLSSFLIPAAIGFLAYSIYAGESIFKMLATLGGVLTSLMAFSIFCTLQWKTLSYGNATIMTGGTIGVWMSNVLSAYLNPVGASIVALSVFLVSLALATPIRVTLFFVKILQIIFPIITKGFRIALGVAAYAVLWICQNSWKRLRAMEVPRLPWARVAQALSQKMSVARSLIRGPDVPQTEPIRSSLFDVESETLERTADLGLDSSAPSSIVIEPRLGLNLDEEKPIKRETRVSRGTTHWKLPSLDFLSKAPKIENAVDRDKILENSKILQQKLLDFDIEGEITAVRPGPVITLYEFKPGPGVKVSRIAALADDLSMALSAESVRILAPLPGKAVVGIEVPTDNRERVYFREFLQKQEFYDSKYAIPLVMGKDIGGQVMLSDLARMPHLLCAGQTGSGKSVFMNTLICSMLYRFTPDELRMILVDPKFIEFRSYQDIPHLLLPVVDDAKEAAIALKWAVREMERRYRILAMLGVRNLQGFNQKVTEMGPDLVHDLLFSEENQASYGAGDWVEAFDVDEKGQPKVGKLPNIVIIIDELADLMMVARKEVEISIARIAQKARAAGIHLVIATQRPSTDVITGLIKANLPSRVSFQLASFVDSKTILDRAGAERLLGQGDMLFIAPATANLTRLHGAFLDDKEIEKIAAYLKSQGAPAYRNEILVDEEDSSDDDASDADQEDELYREAVLIIKENGHASASYLQRHLKIGYNRAARLIEMMEARGIVGPADGARPREVLVR